MIFVIQLRACTIYDSTCHREQNCKWSERLIILVRGMIDVADH